MMRRLAAWLACGLCAALVWFAGGALERRAPARSAAEELLYLPNGKHLRMISMGQAPVLADLIYIWAIQHYSSYERADRYRYVEHVFGDVIAELDPHYIDSYWLGALILTVEAQDLEAGLRLLDKGIAANPDQWILPYLAAWESYRGGDYQRAAAYFTAASEIPGAPHAVHRMRAGVVSRAGDLNLALRLWEEVRNDPQSDAASIAIAERQVRNLRASIELRDLQAAVDRFRAENARFPASLEELRQRDYIRVPSRELQDSEYGYDPRTGRVSSTAGRVLGES